ncbi:MAG: response regulator [Candidatus Paceibacterota bacterium]|jgi:two-component system chemotaxis response regulator CheY
MTTEKRKILILDDDRFLLNMYSMKFEKNGFDVKVAGGGPEALEILKEGFKPDIMLMDLIMPVMDGFTFYETAKNEKLADGIIAIMLTNQGLVSDINRAKELGVHGYIVKATTIPSEVVEEVIQIYNNNKK